MFWSFTWLSVITVTGKEGVEVKRGGGIKVALERPLPGPHVGFHRALIMSWRDTDYKEAIYLTLSRPLKGCVCWQTSRCVLTACIHGLFHMYEPYECAVPHILNWNEYLNSSCCIQPLLLPLKKTTLTSLCQELPGRKIKKGAVVWQLFEILCGHFFKWRKKRAEENDPIVYNVPIRSDSVVTPMSHDIIHVCCKHDDLHLQVQTKELSRFKSDNLR